MRRDAGELGPARPGRRLCRRGRRRRCRRRACRAPSSAGSNGRLGVAPAGAGRRERRGRRSPWRSCNARLPFGKPGGIVKPAGEKNGCVWSTPSSMIPIFIPWPAVARRRAPDLRRADHAGAPVERAPVARRSGRRRRRRAARRVLGRGRAGATTASPSSTTGSASGRRASGTVCSTRRGRDRLISGRSFRRSTALFGDRAPAAREACASGGASASTTNSTADRGDGARTSRRSDAGSGMRRPDRDEQEEAHRTQAVHRYVSVGGGRPRLHCRRRADVAELVDAHGSGPCGRKPVEVQVLSSAYLRRAGVSHG